MTINHKENGANKLWLPDGHLTVRALGRVLGMTDYLDLPDAATSLDFNARACCTMKHCNAFGCVSAGFVELLLAGDDIGSRTLTCSQCQVILDVGIEVAESLRHVQAQLQRAYDEDPLYARLQLGVWPSSTDG